MAKDKRVEVGMKRRRSITRKVRQEGVTKKDFHDILDKASQPVEPNKPEK
jgi:hypothetical protein